MRITVLFTIMVMLSISILITCNNDENPYDLPGVLPDEMAVRFGLPDQGGNSISVNSIDDDGDDGMAKGKRLIHPILPSIPEVPVQTGLDMPFFQKMACLKLGGGSWNNETTNLQSAYRNNNNGFRCVVRR